MWINIKNKSWMIPLMSGLMTTVLLSAAFIMSDLQPFGSKTLAVFDANIQYLDFYAYYQDVLAGRNSILYSFSKALGGNEIAVFSYYLSSPFCFLLPLFSKSQLNLYFNITVFLKTVLASVSMGCFLGYRFKKKTFSFGQKSIMIALAVSYAMSQYSISQANNIMWLDSVYLLPVMMLGVSRFVQQKKYTLLSTVVGLAIVFNWYSAGISCVFAFIWFVYEYCDAETAGKKTLPDFIKTFFQFGLSMLLGVMLSAAIFLPTAVALKNGSRGTLETGSLLDFSFISKGLNIIPDYVYGAISFKGSPALYSGIIALAGMVSLVISPKVPLRNKIPYTALIVFLVLMFCWSPLITVFSLFKQVDTYWYRYAFIGVFIITAMAGEYCCLFPDDLLSPSIVCLTFACAITGWAFLKGPDGKFNTFMTAGAAVFVSLILLGIRYNSKRGQIKNALIIFLTLFAGIDCFYNYRLLAEVYSGDDVSFDIYQEEMAEAIGAVKQYDQSYYRISQTSGRIVYEDGRTTSYNEAMAFNYWSISGYTSSPDDNQRDLLEMLGYRKNGLNFNVTNTCVLPTDSLLGVRYILSPYDIKGLKRISDKKYNSKYIYNNPYCLPIGFVYNGGLRELNSNSTFEFQNDMFTCLVGEEAEIYKKLEYTLSQDKENAVSIELEIPEGNYSVYGNITPLTKQNLELDVNGVYTIAYGVWNSQSVFNIPAESTNASIIINSDQVLNPENYEYEFYALDLNRLEELASKISKGQVPEMKMEHGYAEFNVKNAGSGEKLFVSIPYDSGWKITVNGTKAEYDLLGGVLYTIHLDEGDNTVLMKYQVPALDAGIICTASAVLLLAVLKIFELKRKSNQDL